MLDPEIPFVFTQTIISFISTGISFFIAYYVSRRLPDSVIHKYFLAMFVVLGLSQFFVGLSDVYILLIGFNYEVLIRLAFSLIAPSLMFFLYAALVLYYGEDVPHRTLILALFVLLTGAGLVSIWVLQGVQIDPANPYNAISSTEVEITVFLSSFLLFLGTTYFYFLTYKESDSLTREKFRHFLVGLTFSGLALLVTALNDLTRFFDLLDIILLTTGTVFYAKGLIQRVSYRSELLDKILRLDMPNSIVMVDEVAKHLGMNKSTLIPILQDLIETKDLEARLDENNETLTLAEHKPIAFMIVQKSGLLAYSYSFIQEKVSAKLFGPFISLAEMFVEEAFEGEHIQFIKQKNHRVLISRGNELLYCYVFKGRVGDAYQKCDSLLEELGSFSHHFQGMVISKDQKMTDRLEMTVKGTFNIATHNNLG